MKSTKLNLKDNCTARQLKEFLEGIPDDTVIDICNIRNSGTVNSVELEFNIYENIESIDLYLNIESESGHIY